MSTAPVYILLATYQGETWLPELLRSIQKQSHSDWTLLVRDDGSRDATGRFSTMRPGTIGGSSSRRRRPARCGGKFLLASARGLATGPAYILPADQDDIWRTDKVARQVQALQAAEAGRGREVPRLVYCDAAVVDAAGRPVHASFLRQNRLPYGSGRPLKTLLGRSFVLGCACAVNRPLMELALPLPEVVASHDWWLGPVRQAAGQITCLDVPLLDYRRHAANASQLAVWNILRDGGGDWRRRWDIGWKTFLRSLQQAEALCNRLRERNVAWGEERELLEAFCQIVKQPGRWRKLLDLHRLGVPAID